MIADTIRFFLANFTLTFLLIGLLAAAIALLRAPRPLTRPIVVEKLLSYFLLWSVAIDNLYNFVFHVFFGDTAARFIGWAQSPFQAEVGFASLGFAVLGLLAYRGSRDYRVAAVVAPACFTLGAAAGHVVQMVTANNFAPGNAGVIFYTDLLIPLIGLTLLWLQHHYAKPVYRPVSGAHTVQERPVA